MFTIGNLTEIGENFSRYRCNPLLIPFASSFGYDTRENFNYCLSSVFNQKAAVVFAPIYGLLSNFTTIIQLIVDVALGLRKLFANFLFGVNTFIRSVRDRIQGLLFNIRISLLKMNTLMNRVYGTMYSVIWMGTSAMTAGMNVADNSLVKFLFEFCFDPDTEVCMADGSWRRIRDVVIGDALRSADGTAVTHVTSTFVFDGVRTPMVRIGDVLVSAEHYVQCATDGVFHPAHQHPDAVPAASIPRLYCLNVADHQFRVRNGDGVLVVSDYDEHSTRDVVYETQAIALRALNGGDPQPADGVDDYSLGVDGALEVRMADGSWRRMDALALGDTVWNSGHITGIVCEHAAHTVECGGGAIVSPAQIVFDGDKWVRAAHIGTLRDESKQLYSIITSRGGTLEIRGGETHYFIRDYREVSLPEMEAAYQSAFDEN
jgi:hypothetical protein